MKKTTEKLPAVDYTKLPKDLEEAVEPTPEIITEKAKIGFDGRQYFVRFPTEIAKLLNLTAEDKIHFTLKRPHPKTDEETEFRMDLQRK